MRAGTVLTQLVEFSEGQPDGDITWALLSGTGDPVADGTITPDADSVSAVITVSSGQNALGAGESLFAYRELSWDYTVGGLAQTGRRRYRLEAFLPFGVSEDGVRHKLGLEGHELADEAVDLVGAYVAFKSEVTSELLGAVTGETELFVGDAIEALAALKLLPTLQVLVAAKESSGTSQYQRDKINWQALRAHLENLVATGYALVNPATDTSASLPPLLIAVVRADPVTNT